MEREDTISRQFVIEQTYNWSKDEFLRVTNPFDYLRKRINSLPSVTPQPKIGHWVKSEEMSIMWDIWTCSECGCGGDKHFKYCAYCGAKMIEPQGNKDIELVIKIPEKQYQSIKNGHIPYSVLDTIMNSTPLPKGHGRLIDADVFEKRLMDARSYYIGEKADDFDLRFAAGFKSAAERLVNAPTIIEADKGE